MKYIGSKSVGLHRWTPFQWGCSDNMVISYPSWLHTKTFTVNGFHSVLMDFIMNANLQSNILLWLSAESWFVPK